MADDKRTAQRQARLRQRQFQGGTVFSAGTRGHMPTGQSREIKVTPSGVYRGSRRAAAGGRNAALAVTTRRKPGASHLLAAELLAGAVIVGIRVTGDYQVNDEGTTKGTIGKPANGGYGPFTVLAGLLAAFFILSFVAAGGGTRARVAVAIGALIDLVLLLKSMDEITIVSKYITADPATRTVTTADYTLSSQPWGSAGQIGGGGAPVMLTAAQAQASPAFYGSTGSFFGGAGPSGGGSTAPGSGSAPGGGTVVASGLGAKIAAAAEKLSGDPYLYGGTTPAGFDCAGLVQYVLGELGISAPRTSEEQYAWATPVSKSSLEPGDLVFAQFPGDNASPGHVGIYVGNGEVLSAQDPSLGVGLASLSSWAGNIVGYGAPPASTGTAV
jgi:cell wall-associated NlpC family hydrolase